MALGARVPTDPVQVARLWVYPVKSLPGIEVMQADITTGGALAWDRRFALVDKQGRFLNSKRTQRVHALPLRFVLEAKGFCWGDEWLGESHDDAVRADVEARCSAFFGMSVTLTTNATTGFPDDTFASGPTVISTPTLAAVADWFPGMTVAECRARFRANIELHAPVPFWEDRLFGQPDHVREFSIGGVRFAGTNPCQRCIVPSRNPATGARDRGFQTHFVAQRKAQFPDFAESGRFEDHHYRLAVNTRVLEAAQPRIHVGDSVVMGADRGVSHRAQ